MFRQRISIWVVLGLSILWAASRHASPGQSAPLPTGADPSYSENEFLLANAISCPQIVPEAQGVVLLIHGSGLTPQINWNSTLLQPLIRSRYQPYYLEVPYRLFRDIQVSAEYISHAIKKLSQEQKQDITIISWSAGSLATQWTLVFYPETRAMTKKHIAIGASYRGSWSMVPLFYLNMYSEAIVQQLPGSNLLATLGKFGGMKAVVPTTNIGSSTDQIVQPSFYGEVGDRLGFKDAWKLNGPLAWNIDIFKECAAASLRSWRVPRLFTHDSMLWEAASHAVIFDALNNGNIGRAAAVLNASICHLGPSDAIQAELRNQHASILPELLSYAPTQEVIGWPEVAIRDYAR
ncbi:Lipase B [Paramyrothecium foliicola]|nr:Lipase B [Paramyrothecium foliicola]